MVTKQLNIKNRTYIFWNDLINHKDKKSSMDISIYYIGYATKKPK